MLKRTSIVMLVAALTAGVLAVGASRAAPPDLKTLTECSDRAWSEDIGSWKDYAFDRHITRRSLDTEGNTTSRQQLLFRVTPQVEGFDEELLQIDGREPTAKEVAKHRKNATFTRHYSQAEQLELNNPLGENLALLQILQAQEYRIVGEDEVNGVPCYRAVFDARPAPAEGNVREQLQYAVMGSGCFSVEGCHLVVFEMETVRPLKEGPFKMERLQLTFQGQAVDHDGWLLKSVEMHSDVSVLFKKIRKYNSYRYSDIRHQPRR